SLLADGPNKIKSESCSGFSLFAVSIKPIQFLNKISRKAHSAIAMSADSGELSFKEQLIVSNEAWRGYRITGADAYPGSAARRKIYREHGIKNPRPIPNPNTLLFFENWKARPNPYLIAHESGAQINRSTNINPRLNWRSAQGQRRYRDVTAYFGEPRYAVQKVLGMGGNGLALHFKDRGSLSTANPGRDIVIKVALEGWECDDIVVEKRMMRKVKGSAHCVQIIDPQDVGKTEEPAPLQLLEFDSSTDDDSSGNESSTRAQVQRRHRIPKRKSRSDQYWRRKKRRKNERVEELDEEITKQEKLGARRDYIIMEYLHNGSLGSLIVKLNEKKKLDPRFARVPNRVLWGFWLCLIRACIAMEYPPRKFHPLRKKPEEPQGAVSFLRAKANNMLRECKRLGIQVFDLQEHARRKAQYDQLEGDLIENIPNPTGKQSLNWKRERRQNMLHRDIDPTNIFIDGFELDGTSLKHWEEALLDKKKDGGKQDFLTHTGRRPDRLCQEHELIPRLKVRSHKTLGLESINLNPCGHQLGDFGMATCIKREKRNEYYLHNRTSNKSGEHPPEYFGPEWEKVEGGKNGDYLANSRTCGYYSNKTNIWSIALSMWELITLEIGPLPPQPQPPYDQRDSYPAYNDRGQANYDLILKDPAYADFKISYCSLLLDPDVHDFDWVDKRLRRTIFECLYHKPDDRPTLEELLREAEENIQADKFPQETDAQIRDWIQSCILDAQPELESSASSLPPPPPPPPPTPQSVPPPRLSGAPSSPKKPSSLFSASSSHSPPPPPLHQPQFLPPPRPSGAHSAPKQSKSQLMPQDSALQNAIARDDPNNPIRQQMQASFNADFRYGYTRVPNSGDGLMCGLFAIADSLIHQLGLQPTINGVTHNLNSLPTADDLFNIYKQLKDSGHFDLFLSPNQLAEDRNFNVDTLGLIISEWGKTVNIELALGYILGGRGGPPMHTMSPYDNPKLIWIYNNNAQDTLGVGPRVLNHYEGLRPNDDLPDYESSD
ncbi:kinase-like domain-containing protein, partial [Xylaria sp. FL1042]